MAGKVNTGGRVRASSLLEVVVAMVILLIVFGIAMTIYVHVARANISSGRLQAQTILEAKAADRQLTSRLGMMTFDTLDLHVVIAVQPREGAQELRTVVLTAYRDSARIAEKRLIVLP
jgi:Tfp pilus assembly protein PilE